MRLHVRMPTRQRPKQALEALEAYRTKANHPVSIEVVVDHDDATMQAPEVIQKLQALDVHVTGGVHESKIEAVNAGRIRDWDVLLLASDDMMPVVDNYGERAVEAMTKHFPHLDGAIYFDDGYQGSKCCTLPIIGRRFHEQFGRKVYEPAYKSLWSDREQTDVWQALGRLQYVDKRIIEHRHPVSIKCPVDDLYARNDAFWHHDKGTYERRKGTRRPGAQLGFDSPPLWLSILICTVPHRRAQLERLLDFLWGQILALDEPRWVEIIVDAGEGSIGSKRQSLLERAKGHFVVFIDDDDWVATDYVERVVGAVSQSDADCASLLGIITTDGRDAKLFEHSLKYDRWFTAHDRYARCPNHLNAVARTAALQTGFISVSHGEDSDYSIRLRSLLKKEASTGTRPLYFYDYRSRK